MNTQKLTSTFVAVLIAFTSVLASPFSSRVVAQSSQTPARQAPKPPTDAKKVIDKPRNGKLTFAPDDIGFESASTQLKDFDLTFSVVNPALPRFFIGADFRSVSFSRFYILYITSDGETGLAISREYNNFADVKGPTFAPSWQKNAGDKNDVALYVRGTVGLLFINKVFVDQYDLSEINDFGNSRLFAFGGENVTGEIDYKNLTIKVPNNALPPTSNGPTNAGMLVSLYRSGYQQWGRPAGMDDPRKGCTGFDDSRPVVQFQAVMKVTNNTKLPMKRWAPLAIKRNGQLAFGCALAYDKSPTIEPGQSADMTVEYYIERGEAISQIFVFDLDNGRSNRLQTPAP